MSQHIRRSYSPVSWTDHSLLPWNIDETIASRNPQALEKDHFMQTHGYAAFWTKTYTQSTKGIRSIVVN